MVSRISNSEKKCNFYFIKTIDWSPWRKIIIFYNSATFFFAMQSFLVTKNLLPGYNKGEAKLGRQHDQFPDLLDEKQKQGG